MSFYFLIIGFCYGYLSCFIIAKLLNLNVSFTEILRKSRYWLTKSILFLALIYGGFFILVLPFRHSLDGFLIFSLIILIVSIATFTFYPTFIVSNKSFVKSIISSFTTNYQSILKWILWYLILTIIAGIYTFAWVRMPISEKIEMDVYDLRWQIHAQWLGGYYFNSFWYSDVVQWFSLQPAFYIDTLVILSSAIITILIKIKVIKILIDNSYITEADTIFAKNKLT